MYQGMLNRNCVFWVDESTDSFNSYHTFVIQVDARDALRAHLHSTGIETAVHYPVPIHLQPAATALGHQVGDFPRTEYQAGRILTLPIHPYLDAVQVERVADAINAFNKNKK